MVVPFWRTWIRGMMGRRCPGRPAPARRSVRLFLEIMEGRCVPSITNTFSVTSVLDDGSAGTLRAALLQSNAADPGPGNVNAITFGLGGVGPFTIAPQSALPTLTRPVEILGLSQASATVAAPLIVLDGSSVAPGVGVGLTLAADGCQIEGLDIVNWKVAGVEVFANNDTIDGNTIGITTLGAAAPNGLAGVYLGDGAAGNFVGVNPAVPSSAGNLISGNTDFGVWLAGPSPLPAKNNTVAGNKIGTDRTGKVAVGNGLAGVLLSAGAAHNTIGGALNTSAENLISGNGPTNNPQSNASGVYLSGPGTTGNTVSGNVIGLSPDGHSVKNGTSGVTITGGATANTIGGNGPGQGNIISGNGVFGLFISGSGTTGNVATGNGIGVGTANAAFGVDIAGAASGNILGPSSSAGAANLISGNVAFGAVLQDAGTSNNLVQNNTITSNGAGGVVLINGASSNMIGGPVLNNTIARNGGFGVALVGPATSGNLVLGNAIGVTFSGGTFSAAPNGTDGVEVTLSAANNIVGGTPGLGNLIAANARYGIWIDNSNTTQVLGNTIGEAGLGNGGAGVFITDSALSNAIGGINPGDANAISYNGGAGVLIGSDPARGFTIAAGTGNSVLGNSIVNNMGLGIDLGPNDDSVPPHAPGSGPNNFLAPPVLTTAVLSGATLQLSGTLTSTANTLFRIEFFVSVTADASGYGQGARFLGYVDVTASAAGTASFTITLPAGVAVAGDVVSATATDLSSSNFGSTSEFAQDKTL